MMSQVIFQLLPKTAAKLVFALGLIAGSMAFGGTRDGGGGIGVRCDGNPSTLQVLDLYESENLYRQVPLAQAASLELEVLAVIDRMAEIYKNPILGRYVPDLVVARAFMADFYKKVVFTSQKQSLTKDATMPLLRPNCEFVQIAVYKPDNKIHVQTDLWQQLDIRNQAALIIHEYFYRDRRDNGDINSDQARKFVGDLFSTSQMPLKYGDMPSQDVLFCKTYGDIARRDVLAFYVYYSKEENGYIANFSQLVENSGIINWRFTTALGPINIFNRSYNSFDVISRAKAQIDNGRYDFRFYKEPQDVNPFIEVLDTRTGKKLRKPFDCSKAN